MISYTWRGQFGNAEVNALHAEGFQHEILADDDWRPGEIAMLGPLEPGLPPAACRRSAGGPGLVRPRQLFRSLRMACRTPVMAARNAGSETCPSGPTAVRASGTRRQAGSMIRAPT